MPMGVDEGYFGRGGPEAPWRHTEGCARGAPTSFRIGPEFVGSLTKIKALVLW